MEDGMARTSWSLQDAKNRFSEVVDRASRGVPQLVTRRGVKTVVVLSCEAYEKLLRRERRARPSFREHLLAIPKGGPDDPFERIELRSRGDEP
jgi:antitoxin Phd